MIRFDRAFLHGRVVAVAVEELADAALDELHPDERARALVLAPMRGREWVAGRRALRRALASVATDPALSAPALLADDRGAPVVPRGAVGSVSHKRALAVALAALDAGWTIGVDLEVLGPRRIDVSRRVLTAAELAALADVSGPGRDRAVILAFALKEAIYKAVDPHLKRYVGFQEVAVWPAADGSAGVTPVEPWGLDVEAAWAEIDGYVVCTARARPTDR